MGEETYPPKGRRSPSQPTTLPFPLKEWSFPLSLPTRNLRLSLPRDDPKRVSLSPFQGGRYLFPFRRMIQRDLRQRNHRLPYARGDSRQRNNVFHYARPSLPSMEEETYPPKGRQSPSQPATLSPSKGVELPSLPSKEEDTSLPSKG